jgi:hypothetical protein
MIWLSVIWLLFSVIWPLIIFGILDFDASTWPQSLECPMVCAVGTNCFEKKSFTKKKKNSAVVLKSQKNICCKFFYSCPFCLCIFLWFVWCLVFRFYFNLVILSFIYLSRLFFYIYVFSICFFLYFVLSESTHLFIRTFFKLFWEVHVSTKITLLSFNSSYFSRYYVYFTINSTCFDRVWSFRFSSFS